ncbi:MAG: DNA mismatch repair ATPase MutS [Saprospiraceae bacterium]|jgi:DNA mismatch repair ATPase MutS
MENLREIYEKRVADFSANATTLQSKYVRFSLIRLVTFIIALAVIILLFTIHVGLGVAGIVIFLLAFSRFITWHNAVKREQELNENLVIINQKEISFLDEDYSVFDGGKRYVNAEHPYTTDLDIFGEHSYFQSTNRTASAIGHERLADYLRYPTDFEEITRRQISLAELKDKMVWRQEFQAVGLATEDDITHVDKLKKWLHEEPYISNNSLWKILILIAPFLALGGLILWLTVIPWYVMILFFLPAAYALKQTVDRINVTHKQTNKAEKILAGYAAMIQHIEKQEFSAPKLRELRDVFFLENKSASEQISELSYIISQLNLRNNFFAIFFNFSVLWDLKQVKRLERWRETQNILLPKWFEALAEFEALNSLATAYYNNPDWTFPEVNKAAIVRAEELGHPLIPKAKRINNDISIPTKGHLKLVTGSNMAGKSTFMRTVGLNIVLAQIGAPVCAKKLSLPPLKVYTSMRTEDALHESTSSFYAELKRLKFIITAVESGENIFFLLDEILKGTNSRDRHTGSKALIRQLIEAKGSGIIATHDLDLGVLEKEYGGAVENLRIEVQIHDGKLFFDYKVKPGVSESFNATILMQQMGIRIPADEI